METTRFSEPLVYVKLTRRHIQEDGIRHSHRRDTTDPTKQKLSETHNKIAIDLQLNMVVQRLTSYSNCSLLNFGLVT
jgi:hypothetical protein